MDNLLVSSERTWEYDGNKFYPNITIREDGLKLTNEKILKLNELIHDVGKLENYKKNDQIEITDLKWEFQITIGDNVSIVFNEIVLAESDNKKIKNLIDYLIFISPLDFIPDYYISPDYDSSLDLKEEKHAYCDTVYQESEIFLGYLKVDQKEFEVNTIVQKYRIAKEEFSRGIIIFQDAVGSRYQYEVQHIEDLPDGIIENQLMFFNSSNQMIFENLPPIGTEICFESIGECFELIE